jgi:hypothetical protein
MQIFDPYEPCLPTKAAKPPSGDIEKPQPPRLPTRAESFAGR